MKHYNGFGVGLRPNHFSELDNVPAAIDWFELLTEDYLQVGGEAIAYAEAFAKRFPCALHGVSLSIGSTDSLNYDYVEQLALLIERFNPLWVSDHFCWTGVNGVNIHDLMPLPYNKATIDHLIPRIREIQAILSRPILLENVSSYVSYHESTLSEWQFMTEVAGESDCLLLLDINNVYVNARNFNFDPIEFIESIPVDRVYQMHLAGHNDRGDVCIDTHDQPIVESVWTLYALAVKRFTQAAVIIERDADIPSLAVMASEVDRARTIKNEICNVVA